MPNSFEQFYFTIFDLGGWVVYEEDHASDSIAAFSVHLKAGRYILDVETEIRKFERVGLIVQ